MTRAEIGFPALLFGLVAGLLAIGYFHYEYSWTTLAFPLAAGALLCLLCALEIAAVLRGQRVSPPASDEEAPSPASIAWMFALAPFLYLLGFVFGSAAFLLVFLRAHGSSWRLSIATAVVSLLVAWAVFIKLMGVSLPIFPLWWGE